MAKPDVIAGTKSAGTLAVVLSGFLARPRADLLLAIGLDEVKLALAL
jgi:hypothetical protein